MKSLESSLKSVTVYPDRARLMRAGKINLEPGEHKIEIADLPAQLDVDSLRASAMGNAPARLQGVQAQRRFYTETPVEQVCKLEQKLEALQDELKVLDVRVELIKQQRTALDAFGNNSKVFARALAKGKLAVDVYLALTDSLRVRAEKLDAELQQWAIEKRELERRSQKAANELNQLTSSRQRQSLSALVEIEMLEAGDITIELYYVIAGAGWQPLYDLRLVEEAEKAHLEVSYLAQVAQSSGEAWKDVALSLSTARPAVSGEVPELDPWYIQPRPVMPPQSAPLELAKAQARVRAKPEKLRAADGMVAFAAADAEPSTPADVVTARVDTSGAAVTYHVSGTVTIPADGQPHKVTAARFSLQPRLDYVTAPKLVEAAYRRAVVVNESDYLLLPGAANLFAGDEFIGSTKLELTAPQGEIELYLGVDDRIKVKRELKRRDIGKNLIGGKRRMAYAYEIKLENLLASEAAITVHDQLPVSRHEDIKVKLESTDPKPGEKSELNLLDWDVFLAPQEKLTLRFDFSVEAPQDLQIIGLP